MAKKGTITLKELKKENESEQAVADKAEEERQAAAEEALGDDDLDDDEGEAGDDDQPGDQDDQDPDDSVSRGTDDEDPDEDPADDSDDDDPDPDQKPESKDDAADDWMLDDKGEAPDPEKKFTNTDAKHIRQKYKGTIDDLKAENEELKKQQAAPADVKPDLSDLKEPLRSDFKEDLAYLEARQDYKSEITRREQQTRDQARDYTQQKNTQQANTNRAVDEHYVRADVLVQKSGIAPEKYQQADTLVRQALEASFPDAGDAIVDSLIARLGPGSEKVIFNLGVNKARREELIAKFTEDSSGIAAAIYLGDLKAQLAVPGRKSSTAPKPAAHVGGDGKPEGGQKRALLKAYRSAHTKSDGQAAFNIKKKAKAAGIDTSEW
tara:strand:- start:5479 stop:6615 length:1137 start_codon:yes stop_codon:yes gene_type:complete